MTPSGPATSRRGAIVLGVGRSPLDLVTGGLKEAGGGQEGEGGEGGVSAEEEVEQAEEGGGEGDETEG